MYHIVIPARYGSTRLPAKALADINGKPLVYWVWRQAMQSKAVSVTVATDDVRIQEAMMLHGAEVLITDPDHPSGTDRLAEVARLKDWDSSAIVVNLQGDEPLMPVANLEQVADLLNGHPEASIATLCEPIDTADAFQDASVVKVVSDASGRAQYFSRSPIPHVRGGDEAFVPAEARRHVGLYAYRVSFLADFASQPVAPLEQLESLEQLRALHCGHEIRIADAIEPVPAGVDTQKDLDAVRRLMAP
jgi:3-deoxy-manno-octulosonate cytidylyltransferase (CMP-KDO synthetase)